jgi:hypothetical protein
MKKFSVALAFLLSITLAEATYPVAPDAGPNTMLARLAKQRRDAARKTYEVTWTNYRERRTSEDLLYRWSVRWLEAERQLSDKPADQVAAFQEHWERMRALERLIGNLQRAGQAVIDEVSGTEYYRVEAEVWLLQAKEKKDR